MEPQLAEKYFLDFCSYLEKFVKVEKGVFGASMEVSITNNGPVTFSLDF